MLKATGSQGRQNNSSVMLQECDKTADEDNGDASPSEAAKTMTALGGTTLLCKSMMGGGVSARSRDTNVCPPSPPHPGMFSLAYGSAQFGLVLSLLLLGVSFSLALLSLNVLSTLALECKALMPTKRVSFYSVSNMILPRFSWVLDVSVILLCGGAVISYMTNIGNLLAEGVYGIARWDLASFSLRDTAMVIRAVLLAVLVPLCCLKQLGSTKLAVIFGLCCIFYIVVMTLFYSPCTAARADIAPLLSPTGVFRIFSSFPIFIFAYVGHFSVFHIANEMKEVSTNKLNKVFVAALSTCTLVYCLMLLPFLTFGTDVKQNFLQSLASIEDGYIPAPVTASLIFAALSLSISYVILLLAVRISVMALTFGSRQPEGKREHFLRVSLTICLVLLTFGISAALGANVALPIELAGLLGGNTLGFVFPFSLYLKRYGLKNDRPVFSWAVLCSLVFCCLLYPVSLTGILKKHFF
jgi:amino acid permease